MKYKSTEYISVEEIEKIPEQMKSYMGYINDIVGVLSFSFGLGCLGTSSPAFTARICILFIIVLTFQVQEDLWVFLIKT